MSRRLYKNEIELAKKLFEQGLSAKEAAERMGRPKGSINGLWWRLGLSKFLPGSAAQLATARRVEKNATRPTRKKERKRHVIKPLPPRMLTDWQTRFLNPDDRRAGR